jgi:hypothetical protein
LDAGLFFDVSPRERCGWRQAWWKLCFHFRKLCFQAPQFCGTFINVVGHEEARRLVMEWTAKSDVLAYDVPADPLRKLQLPLLPMICTVATARLIGLPSRSLRPDAFFRACLQQGATIIQIAGVSTIPACAVISPSSTRR